MPFLIYNKTSGNLIDISETLPNNIHDSDSPLAHRYINEVPDLKVFDWNPSTLDFIQKANIISVNDFMWRFADSERAQIHAHAMTDPVVADGISLLNSLVEGVPLTANSVSNFLNYLIYKGVIDVERKNKIING